MKRGFTLIELLAVLVLVGFLAATTTISMVPVAQGLAQVRENAVLLQKCRLAFARASREFTTATNVVSGTDRTIVYWFVDPTRTSHRRTLSWTGTAGDPLTLNNTQLVDNVVGFKLKYYDRTGTGDVSQTWTTNSRVIEMSLRTAHNSVTSRYITNRIAPRNILFSGE